MIGKPKEKKNLIWYQRLSARQL